MVTDDVTVRKQDGRALLHDQHMRNKLAVTLIHDCRRACGASYFGSVLFDENHYLGDRRAIGIDNDYFDRFGVYDGTTHYRQ